MDRIMKKTVTLLFYIFLSGTLVYVSAGEKELGLTEAISISLDNNNRYKIAREKVHEKDLKVSEVWGELWPQLGSSALRTYWGAEKGSLTGSDGQTVLSIVKGTLAVNPGIFYNRLKASREDRIIAINEERKVRLDTIVATIQLYYRVLLAQDVVKLRTDSLTALEENLRVVKAGYKSGTYTKLAFLRAGVAAANEKTRLINSRKDLEQVKSALNIHLGMDIDNPVILDLKALKLDKEPDLLLIEKKEDSKPGLYKELVSVAIKNRPELIQLKHKKDYLDSREMEAMSVYLWPTFFASAEYGANKLLNPAGNINTVNTQFDMIMNALNSKYNPEGWNRTWNFTFGATYIWGSLSPLDSSGPKAGQFRSLSGQNDMELEDFVRGIKLEISDGLLGIESAAHAIKSQVENIKSAEESFRVAILQFKNGIIDNTELLNANVELSSAKALYIQSLYDFQTSKARLNRTLGVDYFTF
jgi:outer membrane protein TolC